jgi:23S rRNA A1618 N6-methylase RlmF
VRKQERNSVFSVRLSFKIASPKEQITLPKKQRKQQQKIYCKGGENLNKVIDELKSLENGGAISDVYAYHL